MEPGSSLPHLQEPVTCTLPEPYQARQYAPSHFLKTHDNMIRLHLGLQVVSFRQVFPPKSCMHLSFHLRATCTAHLVLVIWPRE
jgi:hypothetical protein